MRSGVVLIEHRQVFWFEGWETRRQTEKTNLNLKHRKKPAYSTIRIYILGIESKLFLKPGLRTNRELESIRSLPR